MDNPLFGACWGVLDNPYSAPSYPIPIKSQSAPKSVFSIPINFVNSETPISVETPAMDENTAAIKIQAPLRGFCVRKPRPLNKLRVTMKTKAEAAEIRRHVNDENFVELKMTDWIMSLLLRLDEIQVCHFAMDNPLFGGCWGRVPERRSYQRPHYYYPNRYAATSYDTPLKSENAPKVQPKNVVSIPVDFVISETLKSTKTPAMDENTASIKIQAVFRGFCVRKSRPLNKLRVIIKSKAEAAKIRRRVNDEHVVELIRRDEEERLKMMEWIMSLLLRLDEIQGAISFVRDSRKAVIRELANLQETVDDINAAKPRQDATREVSVTSESAMEERPTVEDNLNEEFKSKELLGDAIELSVSNEKGEESLPSQMQDLQIEDFTEEDNNNNGVENFEQDSSEAGQIVSGTEECTMVDGADKDAVDLKRNKVESPVSEVDASPTIPCTKEWVIVGNARDDENSSESLDLLKVKTVKPDVKVETADFMDCEEAGDKLPDKVKSIENIGMTRQCSLM